MTVTVKRINYPRPRGRQYAARAVADLGGLGIFEGTGEHCRLSTAVAGAVDSIYSQLHELWRQHHPRWDAYNRASYWFSGWYQLAIGAFVKQALDGKEGEVKVDINRIHRGRLVYKTSSIRDGYAFVDGQEA